MSGRPGNPNHDARTGKFTSSGGHNVSNSTVGQRVRGTLKSHIKAAASFGGALAGAAVTGIVSAAISGASKPIKEAAERRTAHVINKYGPKVEKAAARHANTVVGAIKAAHSAQAGGRIAAVQAHISKQSSPPARRSRSQRKG